MADDLLGGFGAELERHDRDRYLSTLYAPAEHRTGLAALLAFSLDLARLRDTISQPLLAQIRLQWWRDALDEVMAGQSPRRHPILAVLAPLLTSGKIERGPLDRMIDAREHDWNEVPPSNIGALDHYAGDTGGALAEARVRLLGATAQEDALAARSVGTAWALTGLIRAIPFHAAKGRVTIPSDIAERFGLDSISQGDRLRQVVAALAEHARAVLAEARLHRRGVSRAALPVLAEARIAQAYLDRLAKLGHDVFDARLGEPDALAAWRLGFTRLICRF